jgi:hypothetical protein
MLGREGKELQILFNGFEDIAEETSKTKIVDKLG